MWTTRDGENLPGAEVAVAAAEELAGEHGLLHAALHLEHLRATLGLAVKLEHEARVGSARTVRLSCAATAAETEDALRPRLPMEIQPLWT